MFQHKQIEKSKERTHISCSFGDESELCGLIYRAAYLPVVTAVRRYKFITYNIKKKKNNTHN